MNRSFFIAILGLLSCAEVGLAGSPKELRVGIARHAFDHLGNIGEQAAAAVDSGANILYATGLGADGYSGLPPASVLRDHSEASKRYIAHSKSIGVRWMIGYVCATSIVRLETFDTHWPREFRANFHSEPAAWRQQDRQGQPLKSWYGGDYEPACMNHPDWREYERQMVRLQLEAGHDGIFFDNPTVHERGCYCPHCMEGFARFLRAQGIDGSRISLEALRVLATDRSKDFLRYRATIARDFLAEMRRFARSIRPNALITCNNSLNSPGVLFSQSRTLGYNIFELSKAEDFVVVEDMATQPRILRDGRVMEYGATYRQLHAINHGKPLVAVTIAEADYHTPPSLVRLAMAEAAAHDASYLSWPTWPESQRVRMCTAVRPQADLLRAQERWLNDTRPRRDAVLFMPFQKWVDTNHCLASSLASVLSRSNVQYEVISEDYWTLGNLARDRRHLPLLVIESPDVLSPSQRAVVERFRKRGGGVLFSNQSGWMDQLASLIPRPSLELTGPRTVRGVLRDTESASVLHLYNLNIERLSSFEDSVTAVENLRVRCRVPRRNVQSVTARSADSGASVGLVKFEALRIGGESVVTFELPRIEISTLVLVE